MKYIKKCPLFFLLLGTGLLFSIIAIWGRGGIYSGQDYDPIKAPILSVMFTAMNDDIYPWQLLERESVEAGSDNVKVQEEAPAPENEEVQLAGGTPSPSPKATSTPIPSPTPSPEVEQTPLPRLEPLRESTYEEYIMCLRIFTEMQG